MDANKVELKNLVDDKDFIDNMNSAFSDLRADYELTMDSAQEKINELIELHVDVNNQLSDLISLSRKSSGTICGLRGTGKTHLMLLARHELNNGLWNNGKNNLCIYLNMKRLCLTENFNVDTFNRMFSIYIYKELSSQLFMILNNINNEGVLDRIINLFNKKKKNVKDNIIKAIKSIYLMNIIAHEGNEQLKNIGMGEFEINESKKELIELISKINTSLNTKGVKLSADIDCKSIDETNNSLKQKNTYLNYLNVNSVRTFLLDIIDLLGIDSITFYVDEWEKISTIQNCQEYTANYIDTLLDNPIYFWIGIVPYRGGLYKLDNGADLQHQINLDESLVYEATDDDRVKCLNYFKEIVNKRLKFYFPNNNYDYKLMFNSDVNFALLVMASMGNTRDFGTMLMKCWSEFQSYRKRHLNPGRPYKYISRAMIIASIKDNGDKKYSNIESDTSTVTVWNDIKNYCISRKSSHFAIEEKTESIDCLREKEFSDLIYHRLIHLRKMHVTGKEANFDNKLSIYAINYAATYSLHSQDNKFSFITEYKIIHDKVRRYIYDPTTIIKEIKIKSGEMFPCVNCGSDINPNLMKAAWEKNSCPFCGGNIYNTYS